MPSQRISQPSASRADAIRPRGRARRLLGYTAIEVVLVLTIVGIVAATSFPKLRLTVNQTKARRGATVIGAMIEYAFAASQRDNASFAVLLIDLDRFKLVNDSLGHSAGDALLKIVAERLAKGRRALRRHVERQFEVELSALPARQRRAVLESVDTLLQLEGLDALLTHQGLSVREARETLTDSLTILLTT